MRLDEHTTALHRRSLIMALAGGALSSYAPLGTAAVSGKREDIRPFRIAVPQSALDDLRRRLNATRWPDAEVVSDTSQGVQAARLRRLVDYWRTKYDWRKVEARLNALPQFITNIDDVDIHFIHVKSKHPNALPLLMTHGWPGSVIELLKVIGPLTDPTSFGGRAEDAFHLVLPSLPGYGFSGRPRATGWGRHRVAEAWHKLMLRVGYTRYVAQGGDWGAVITQAMGNQAPKGLAGIHINMPAVVPKVLPERLSPREQEAMASLNKFFTKGAGYAQIQATRPQTLGYALADSPVGQAAWIYEKLSEWTDSGGNPETVLTRDEMLDDITVYWLTNTATSSARFYWENADLAFFAVDIEIPVGVTVFPGEIYRAPRSWAELCYRKLVYWNEVDKGGHFAAFEQPDLFAREVRAAFASLRG
jgi:pimeloyl-ACP methyl ester carboxylesterase